MDWYWLLVAQAPILFQLMTWFGPGWCCPPICPQTVECTNCESGFGPEEYEVVFSGIVNSSAGGGTCGDCTQFDGTWIVPLTVSGICQYRLSLISIITHSIKWTSAFGAFDCQPITSATIAVDPSTPAGQRISASFGFSRVQGITGRGEGHTFFGPTDSDDCCNVDDPLPYSHSTLTGSATLFTCDASGGSCNVRSLTC